nr:reverse transcriptase domain-containing protein [Tanacetum cinerariifolium]
MSSYGCKKEKEASTHDWGRMSHRDTCTRVEKGIPAGHQKTPAEGKKTLGSSFKATLHAPVNVIRKLKKNGMPLTAKAVCRALGTKNDTTQIMITIKAGTESPKSIGQDMKMIYPNLGCVRKLIHLRQGFGISKSPRGPSGGQCPPGITCLNPRSLAPPESDSTNSHQNPSTIMKCYENIPTELLVTKEVHKRSRRNPSYQAKGGRANGSLHGKIQGRKHLCQLSTRMHEDIGIHARRQDHFTPLTKTPKEILAMETIKFKAQPPMTGLAENRNKNKFFEFYGDKGHNRNECIHLKKQIEEAVKSGQLSHLVKEIKQGGKRGEQAKTDSETKYAGRWGKISLIVTLGDEENSTSVLMNFIVVRSPSPYNGIIGRPGLRKIQAVPFTAHGMLKFPVEGEIVTIRSNTSRVQNGGRNTKCPSTKRTSGRRGNQSSNPPRVSGANPGKYDRCSKIHSRTSLEHPRRMPTHKAKKKGASTGHEQSNSVGSYQVSGSRNHEVSTLPRLALKPSHGKETRWQLEDVCGLYRFKQVMPKRLLSPFENRLESQISLRISFQVFHRCIQGIPPNTNSEGRQGKKVNQGVFCYINMSFGLKNARATYQRLVDKAFEKQIGGNLEVYVDDLLNSSPKDQMRKDHNRSTSRRGNPRTMDPIHGRVIMLRKVPQSRNKKANTLSKIASTSFTHLTKQVLVKALKRKSIEEREILAVVEEEGYRWMTPLVEYLTEGKVKFLIVAVDYFTKWIEAKPVATITGSQVKKFVWDNIVCRFGLLGEILSDNIKQFTDYPFKDWCEKLNIKQMFASVRHPQTNGQVEKVNRSLGEGIKARLGEDNRKWVEEVSHVLWAHRMMIKTSNRDTSFSRTYGTGAVIPIEIGMPLIRCAEVNHAKNDE